MQKKRTHTTKKEPHFVYFITDGHGHIKIGKADNTEQRLKELQTGNPYKLSVLMSVLLSSPSEAFALEQKLHSKLAPYRMEGEWFEEEPVLELIDTQIVQLGTFSFGGLQYDPSK